LDVDENFGFGHRDNVPTPRRFVALSQRYRRREALRVDEARQRDTHPIVLEAPFAV
jgi:hypothetical protein